MRQQQLNQWKVTIGSHVDGMFTTVSCDQYEAMAIAISTFGEDVSGLEDEGTFTVQFSDSKRLLAARSGLCPECSLFRRHLFGCTHKEGI